MGNRAMRGVAVAALSLCLCMPGAALAHGGRTDSNGGHRDNKNASGLGSYHYHHGYEAHLHPGGVCPYESGGTAKSSSQPAVQTHAGSVAVSGAPQKVFVNQPFQLKASISPSNAQEKEITWSSSDPSVAAVTAQGEVTPLRAGTVKISAKTSNGVTETLTLTIAEIPVTSIAVSAEAQQVLPGKQVHLQAVVLPENATNRTVTWTSGDETILKVDGAGVVTGIAPGRATVTAAASGGKTDETTIECLPIPVISVAIQFDENTLENGKLNLDTALQMQAVVQPKDATDPAVQWSVSDETIAEISEQGMLVPQKGGTVTVTARCNDGIEDSVEIEIHGEGNGAVAAGVVGIGVLGAGGWMLYKKKKNV